MGGPARRIVTIGGSAGSIEVLKRLIAELRPDLPAAVLVVVHVLPFSESRLPKLLSARSSLPVRHAVTGDPLAEGTVLVAPPDHHLVVRDDQVMLDHGPTENSTRPSVDMLFRSAARTPGYALCGVVLSGALDDGADGMQALVEAGGHGIVQDPDDAQQRDMPVNTLARSPTCEVLPSDRIAAAINEWAESSTAPVPPPAFRSRHELRPGIDRMVPPDEALRPTDLTCPECHGVLWASSEAGDASFRCRIGHRFTFEALRHVQHAEVEKSMWVAVRALEEEASLCRRIADRAESNGSEALAQRFGRRHREALRHADVLRDLLHHTGDAPAVLRKGD